MDNFVKFNVDIIDKYKNDESQDFSIMRIQALSDGWNSHKLEISHEVLVRDSQTVLGKPIIAKIHKNYNGKEDFKGHETDEVVIGYVPPNAEIRFPEEDNGVFFEVDAVIFKLYSGNTLDIFKRDGVKGVSCEFSYSHGEESPNKIESFTIRGITILGSDDFGNTINPSCKGANARIIKFSEKDAENIYDRFINNEQQISMSQILEKLNNIESKLERKEEEMAEIEKKEVLEEPIEDKEKEMSEETEDSKMEDESKEDAEMEEKESEKQEDEKEEMEAESDEKEAEMEEDKEKDEPEEKEDDKEKMSKLTAELESLKATLSAQEAELSELRAFKQTKLEEDKKVVVLSTLGKVEKYVEKEKFEELKKDAESYDAESINAWSNKVLASVTDKVLMSQVENDTMDMGLPINKEAPKKSAFDYYN